MRTAGAADRESSADRAPAVRAVVADDDATTRILLKAVMSQFPRIEVVGEATDGESAVRLVRRLRPDLVLLDLRMPHLDGSAALDGVIEAAPEAVVVLVSATDPVAGLPLLDRGAVAFLPKGLPPRDLVEQLGAIIDDAFGAQDQPPASPVGPSLSEVAL